MVYLLRSKMRALSVRRRGRFSMSTSVWAKGNQAVGMVSTASVEDRGLWGAALSGMGNCPQDLPVSMQMTVCSYLFMLMHCIRMC